ncbi:hypothetical protein BC831DRAFT_105642 [Entophlyctis helioformis]|nr:hypothetical protein BC831DRAFT_105642 [Entophlyctis helioformis]
MLDTEYLERKPAIAWLPLAQIVGVTKANPEYMAAPHTLRLFIALPWDDSQTPKHARTSKLSGSWRSAVLSAGDAIVVKRRPSVAVYVSADSGARAASWMSWLGAHIQHHQQQQQQRQQQR